ncbi:Coiled-coil domain-containing protein 22 -like protein [Toxocara canis]|uniref:Coiled-coil domain-containing protein 22 homolog n=1 Tax=Toxocara canis TaxID=6265 RepID=A0A0B2VRN7_TOXCA|nr:Coiled-coil domain-containing protein 22 -like protein [Toxocara canis]
MALDFVDRLIVDTLLRLDESVVTSRSLPHGMAARYRAATDVVEAIKVLGVRGDIAYQTLLYGHVKELRNLLIGLIEKLPKECPLIATAKDARTTIVESAINSLRNVKTHNVINKYSFPGNTCWRPSWLFAENLVFDVSPNTYFAFRCDGIREAVPRIGVRQSTEFVSVPDGVPRRVSFRGFSGDVNAVLSSADWRSRGRAVLCASLEANVSTSTISSLSNAHAVRVLKEAVNSEYSPLRSRPLKPPLPAKPKPSIPPKPADLARKDAEKVEEVREAVEARSRLNAIVEEVIALRAAIEMRAQQLAEKKEQQNEYAKCLEELRSQESCSGLDPRVKQLLEEPETVNKLTKYIEESEERMEGLQNRWIALKMKKDEELREAREKYEAMEHEGELQHETSEMLRLADAIEDELCLKQKHLLRLKREVEKMEEVQLNRNAYTKRIFEIVANIRKQQQDIDKVLAENRKIQKEINSLTGKLGRTFTVVEEKLYRDTQRDTSMQTAYRLLVKIHEECSWVVAATEACGRINREIDELNDQIAIQQQKRLDETLEKLLNDWLEVKHENDTLLNTLHS